MAKASKASGGSERVKGATVEDVLAEVEAALDAIDTLAEVVVTRPNATPLQVVSHARDARARVVDLLREAL